MVYMATTPELCFLEYMVHLEGTPLADLPPLILCEIDVPDNSITFLDIDGYPLAGTTLILHHLVCLPLR